MSTKDRRVIQEAIDKVRESQESGRSRYSMTYEDGIIEALEWVMGDIPDSDFDFAPVTEWDEDEED